MNIKHEDSQGYDQYMKYIQSFLERVNESKREETHTAIGLYVISNPDRPNKVLQFKTINLEKLSQTKLDKWTREGRFAIEIEKGDKEARQVLVSPRIAGKIIDVSNKETPRAVIIDGKEAQVGELTEEEYKGLEQVHHIFSAYLEEQEATAANKEKTKSSKSQTKPEQSGQNRQLKTMMNEMTMYKRLLDLENIPEQVKTSFLRRMGELHREIAKKNKEHDEQVAAKKEKDIEIKIKSHQIKEEIIKENELNAHIDRSDRKEQA